MAENQETSIVRRTDEASNKPQNPLFSLLSKFTQVFNFRFPPLPAAGKKEVSRVDTGSKEAGGAVVVGGEVVESSKPVKVTFPDARTPAVPPPLKLEVENADQDTNPIVLWQVYAIGGFFVLRWVLARWNERKANKKPPNEDPPEEAPTNE